MKWISLGIFGLGIILLVIIAGPIAVSQLSFFLKAKPTLIDPTVTALNPVPFVADVLGITSGADYTQASNWFANSALPNANIISNQVNYYTLSIPKVGISDVTVEIGGNDLAKNPVQYLGTAVPGSYGNTVIFGHSTLPQLYKASSPLSVFNYLPQVKIGDEIIVNYDGITYRYAVTETVEIHPDQIDIMIQRFDKHEITLVTCVPLGTYLRRFVVRGELVN